MNRFNDKSTKTKKKTRIGRIRVHVSHTEAHTADFTTQVKTEERGEKQAWFHLHLGVLLVLRVLWSTATATGRNESGTCH